MERGLCVSARRCVDGQRLMGSNGDEMAEPIRRRRRAESKMETGQGRSRGSEAGSSSNDEGDSVPRIDKW